jgi:hypothetical protein
MEFYDRLNAVLHHQAPDKVPFAPYDNLVPRGGFGRELRNKGMGLLSRRSVVWSECPNVRTEIATQADITTTIYHTPEGSVSTNSRTHVSRDLTDGRRVRLDGMVKSLEDYDPAIFMIEDTLYHMDEAGYYDSARDLSQDGMVRVSGLAPPYDSTMGYYGMGTAGGMESWAYAQVDHPDRFSRLLEALGRRQERLYEVLVDAPGEFMSFGSLNGFYGPRQYEHYVVPFYEKYVPLLQAKGKIVAMHAHASNLTGFKDLIARLGVDVVEAFTPPPIGDLSLREARKAWGEDTVIWVNFPETIFWSGREATEQYAIDLLREDAPGGALVFGFTETGTACIVDDETEKVFNTGVRAMMDAIDKVGVYPIS